MDLDNVFVCDIETNALRLEDINRIHVVSAAYKKPDGAWDVTSTNDYDKMRKLFSDKSNTIVGHNFVGFDIPSLEKVLDIKFQCNVIDTLGLSWYLYPKRITHGLEGFGEDFGVPKPVVEDWENLTYENYRQRCEEDCKINTNLWLNMLAKLRRLYDNNDEKIKSVIMYMMHKVNCIHLQEVNPLTIDVELCKKNLEYLENIIEEKVEELKKVMPSIPIKTKKTRPKNPFKKDGSLSATGEKWFNMLEELGLPEDYNGEVEVIRGYKEPNPASSIQVKNYLTSLGWKPKIFKDGANGKVPQLRDDDKNLCSSVLELIKEKPELESLDGLSVAQHRAGILKGFLDSVFDEDKVVAGISKFARTLRSQHRKPCTNLPKVSAQYGDLIRSVIVAPEGYILCGSDISSLENKTLQNAIYHLDKEYVEEMNFPGFDAHLKLGKLAGLVTEQEAEFYSWFKKYDSLERDNKEEELKAWIEEGKKSENICDIVVKSSEEMHNLFDRISKDRSASKTANYALTYACSAPKLAESAKVPLKQAEQIHKAYWEMNWAVKAYTDSLQTKSIGDEEWIYNPASGLWLYLASDHIKFSACNQNAGVKIFDLWVYFMMQEGIIPQASFHDEVLFACKPEDKDKVRKILHGAIEKVNKALNLPIPIEIDVQFGMSYAEVH